MFLKVNFGKLCCVCFIKWSKSCNEFMIESFGRRRMAQGARLCAKCISIPSRRFVLVPTNVFVSISTARLRQCTLQIEHSLSQGCVIHRNFRRNYFTLILLNDIVFCQPGLWACEESSASANFITNCTDPEKWVNLICMIKPPLCRAATATVFPCRFILRQSYILGEVRAWIQSKGI